jgi:hypothetical protein
MKNTYTTGIFLGIVAVLLVSFLGPQKALKVAAADKYKVIKVDGKIVFMPTKAVMKQGDVFLSGTQLSFTSPQARAAVISAIKGRFVLTSSEKGQTKILPAANNISSRSGALLNQIDLQNHFSGKYLILDKISLNLSAANFPMNDDSFFYISYKYENEKINKKLTHEGENLIIQKSELFKIDGKPAAVEQQEMSIFYMANGKANKINDFTPVFPDLDDLKAEVQIILDEFSSRDKEIKINEITAYLDQFYGKPQKDNLNTWLQQEFDL